MLLNQSFTGVSQAYYELIHWWFEFHNPASSDSEGSWSSYHSVPSLDQHCTVPLDFIKLAKFGTRLVDVVDMVSVVKYESVHVIQFVTLNGLHTAFESETFHVCDLNTYRWRQLLFLLKQSIFIIFIR